MKIKHKGLSLDCESIPNPGSGNNCLGFALGRMLNAEPEDLRWALCEFLAKGRDEVVACSILEDFERIAPVERQRAALHSLRHGCFIPADVFIAYCASRFRRRGLLRRHNVVFFAKRDQFYEPVCHYLDDVSLPTEYVGCDGVHYEALKLRGFDGTKFDISYFV